MDWRPPADWTRVTTLDAHAAGEPLRIVTGGWPPIPGATMLEKRRHAREHHEPLRRALMWEPRGHADMYGAVPTEPVTADGDLGVLFLHNEGYSTMCGHGVVALVTAGLETGLFERTGARTVLRIDTPAGRVTATAHHEGERVTRVSFENVPSFVLARDRVVEVPGLGTVRLDLAFGGAFYALVDADALGLRLLPEETSRLIEVGRRVKAAVERTTDVAHPGGDPELGFLYGAILIGNAASDAHSRNVCVFADGEVDRSPTGTGVSARAALHHARGELATGASLAIESLVGTRFEVRVLCETEVGGLPAVVPEVAGSAHLTGRHEFWVDPADPLREGFLLGR
jgi:trans-L-3-hydroxyproline dehydratase